MAIKRDDFETYELWRAEWEQYMEPVVTEEEYDAYMDLIRDEKWEEAEKFFDSVMDQEAMNRNLAKAKELGLRS